MMFLPSVVLATIIALPITTNACTAFIVGKKASSTGYVIVGHNNDGFGPMRYAFLSATDSAPTLQEQGRVGGVGGGKSPALYWQAVYSDRAKVGKATGDVLLNEFGVMMFSNSGGFMHEWGGRKSELPNEATAETVDGGIGLALRFEFALARFTCSALRSMKYSLELFHRRNVDTRKFSRVKLERCLMRDDSVGCVA